MPTSREHFIEKVRDAEQQVRYAGPGKMSRIRALERAVQSLVEALEIAQEEWVE